MVIDGLFKRLGHRDHHLAPLTDAAVLTVAVVAALDFHHHRARALEMMTELGSLSGTLSPSRFNRRLHALSDWFRHRAVSLSDSIPLPVCRRARAYRRGQVNGADYRGYRAAKKEKCFGYRLHLACTIEGIPAAFALLPASCHDVPPVHELTDGLPPGAKVCGDKADNSREDEASIEEDTAVRLVPRRKATMWPTRLEDALDLKECRQRIGAVNSQPEAMGVQRPRARTNEGLELKGRASIFALFCKNTKAA